jgi:hypothetical protein
MMQQASSTEPGVFSAADLKGSLFPHFLSELLKKKNKEK